MRMLFGRFHVFGILRTKMTTNTSLQVVPSNVVTDGNIRELHLESDKTFRLSWTNIT